MTAKIIIPAGIGDVAFMHVKLHALAEALGEEVVVYPAGEEPRRSEGFIDLLPGVSFGGYSTACYRDIADPTNPVISRIDQMRGTTTMLQANTWLEAGHRIDGWLPELPLRYDFKLATTAVHRSRAHEIAGKCKGGPVIAIYPAAYGPVRHWKFWEAAGWVEMARAVHREIGGSFVVIGAEFDLDHVGELTEKLGDDGINVAPCVAEEFGVVVELMKLADLLLAFPSGVPIVASLVGLPTVWWMPDHLSALPGAWLNPKAVSSGRIVTRPFEPIAAGIKGVLESAPLLAIRDRLMAARRTRRAARR